jgi:hypothetical protein
MRQNQVILEPNWGLDSGQPPQLEMRFIKRRAGQLYVLGITHSAIALGDTFTKICQYAPHENPQVNAGQALDSVRLKIVSITAYHNQLNRANVDMTVGVLLKGDTYPLLARLGAQNWTNADGQYHQWRDTITATHKLILTR